MDFKAAVRNQVVGRKWVWTIAVVVATVVVVKGIVNAWPYCGRIVHPVAFVRNFGLLWLVLFLLVGLNWNGRFVVIIILFLAAALLPIPMITPRVGSNEAFAVGGLRNINSGLKSASNLSQVINETWGPDAKRSGYVLELRAGSAISPRPIIAARPSCYCSTGQLSFVLDDSGAIHYTRKDRGAMLSDPILY